MCLFPVSAVNLFSGLGLEAFQGRDGGESCAVAPLGGVTYGSIGCADARLGNTGDIEIAFPLTEL